MIVCLVSALTVMIETDEQLQPVADHSATHRPCRTHRLAVLLLAVTPQWAVVFLLKTTPHRVLPTRLRRIQTQRWWLSTCTFSIKPSPTKNLHVLMKIHLLQAESLYLSSLVNIK
jgi:hypothetical protein